MEPRAARGGEEQRLGVWNAEEPITRRLGAAYGALVAVLALPPLLIGGSMSMGRITSVLFPMFIWLAADVPANYRVGLLVAFATLQGFAAVLFFTWRPLF